MTDDSTLQARERARVLRAMHKHEGGDESYLFDAGWEAAVKAFSLKTGEEMVERARDAIFAKMDIADGLDIEAAETYARAAIAAMNRDD